MRTLLACALLASMASAQMTALINDPMSHGTLGDNKLSLDEAIRIMNTALSYNSLSPAEQAQLRGFPTTVLDTIEVDATITPVITLERQLTNIIGDVITHVDCNFNGINGRPVIDGSVNNVAEVFPARTNHFHLRNMVVKGGQSGVVYDTSLHYHPGEIMLVDGCRFEGQSVVGIQVRSPTFPPGSIQPADLRDTVLSKLPLGLEVLDQGLSADTDVTASGLLFDRCTNAVRFTMNGFGGKLDANFDRTQIVGATTAVQEMRSGSDSTLTTGFVYGSVDASGSAFDLHGDPVGATELSLYHMDVRAGSAAGDHALATTPSGGRFDVAMGEMTFHGDVLLQTGQLATMLRLHNSRIENGSLTLESKGPAADLQWNVLDSAPLTVTAGSTATVTLNQCELVRSPVTDATAGGVTTLKSCYRGQSPLTGTIADVAPAPSRWIGQAWVVPGNPPVGGYVDLQLDLQPGTQAAWLIGLSVPHPVTSALPYRFYFDLGAYAALPGLHQLQDTVRLTIPNNAYLSGFELYAQPVVLPGQPFAPAFHLPRGGRFVIQ